MPPILSEIAWPEWLFGNPWPLVVVLALLFAGLRLVGRRLEKPKLTHASWAALGAMALVIVGSQLVETTQKKLVRQTKELVTASIGPRFDVLDRLLAPEVKVSVGDQTHVVMTGDQALRARLKQAQVKTMSCSNLEATVEDGGNAWVRISVEASGAQWDGAGMTTWRIYWVKTPAGWRATELRLVGAPLNMMNNINLRGR